MRRILLIGLVAAAFAAAPLGARDNDQAAPPPAVYQQVIDCRGIAEATARLACFDSAVAAMAGAAEQKELVVMDRAAVREARRGLFGFTLPKLRLFGGSDDDEAAEAINEIESTVSGLRSAPDGNPIFILPDGARWKQTDGRMRFPKLGAPIRIKRAALGSYMANVDGRTAVRVTRLGN